MIDNMETYEYDEDLQCVECGEIHNKSTCPECGSHIVKVYNDDDDDPQELEF